MNWQWATANKGDNRFSPRIERYKSRTMNLSDLGFCCKDSVPDNLKLCAKLNWNERGILEIICTIGTICLF